MARALFYGATFLSLALLLRTALLGPPPTWVALSLLLAYLALVLCGVFLLPLGMFLEVICRGPRDQGTVALTFDDGPNPDSTPKILDVLEARGAKASFFVIGRKAAKYPELVREIERRGHAIGIHSFEHDRLFALRSTRTVREDLRHAQALLKSILGYSPPLFRPPIGHSNPRIAKVVTELELFTIAWSVRAYDGLRSASSEAVFRRVAPKLNDGAIVLLHDSSERDDYEPASVEALPRILDVLERKGLRAVRVDDFLLADSEVDRKPAGDNNPRV